MNKLVPVPHAAARPTSEFTNRYDLKPIKSEYVDDLEEAHDIVSQCYQDYAGYPDIQKSYLEEALDDIAFRREVKEASERINGLAVTTGLYLYEGIQVKDETQQLTRAYKLRGATNFIFKYADLACGSGVITASAGNHGQAVALAASKLGVEAVVVVPEGTPNVKIEGIESQGGRVIVHGDSYAGADDKAREINQTRNGLYVPAYNSRDIMAGQGTMGLELLGQVPDITDLIVPTGGGGALAALAKYFRTVAPEVRIWGSGVTDSSAVENAFKSGNVGMVPNSRFADGIAVSKLGSLTWPEIKRSVAGVLTVDELTLKRTVGRLCMKGKIVEGAGAVGLSATLKNRESLGTTPVTIATGGNIDGAVLRDCQRLAMGGRSVRLT